MRPKIVLAFLVLCTVELIAGLRNCVPDFEARAALRDWNDKSETLTIPERRRLIDALAVKFPADFEIQERRMAFYRGAVPDAWPGMRQAFTKRAAQKPGDPMALLLAAAALSRTDTPRAIELLSKVLEMPEAPPSAALKLAEIYQTGRFKDGAKSTTHFAAYADACAEYVLPSAIRIMGGVADSRTQAPAVAKRLRARLDAEESPDPSEYELLWALEFRSRPPSEHPNVRKQVAKDLERLFTINADGRAFGSLLAGIKQSGASREAITAFEDRILMQAPASSLAYRITHERWSLSHKEPASHADSAGWEAWKLAYRTALRQWVSQFTEVTSLEESHTAALMEAGELNDQETILAVDKSLRQQVLRNTASLAKYASTAQTLLAKGDATRAHAWMKKAWSRAEDKDHENLADDTLTEEQRKELLAGAGLRGVIAPEYLRAIAVTKNAKAPASLRSFVEGPMPARKADWINRYRAIAWLAVVDRRQADVLAAFQRAVVARDKPPQFFRGRIEDALLAEANSAFLKAGGTERAFALWRHTPQMAGRQSADGQWEKPKRPLPLFELTDTSGSSWRTANFAGKVMLINLWATWCGPCRAELPQIQKLHERTKARPDLQVISFNVDEDVGRVEPYMKQHGYTFPTLLAHAFVRELLDRYEVPQNWLVDQNGNWISTQLGFDSRDADWVDSMLKRLEAAKNGGIPASR